MSTLFALFFLPFLLWLAAWRLLGDRNGWLALANAWAWWLLTAALPTGTALLWQRSKLAAMAWATVGSALWLGDYGWMRPAPLQPLSPGPRRPRATPADSGKLSLLTFNLLNSQRDLSPTLALVAREEPDMLFFQECIPSHAAHLEVGLSDGLNGCYPHRLWLPATEYGMGFGVAGRLPFALTGFWQFPGFEPFAARITLPLPISDLTDGPPVRSGRGLDIYCVQFISPTNEVRRMGPTALLRLRERQIGWVLGEIARRERAAIVAGDWNTTEGADAYQRATVELVDGWREAGRGPGWTWPRSLNPFVDQPTPPLLRLDYLMHTGRRFGPGLAVAHMQVIHDDLGSDHCPLLVQLGVS